MIVHRQDDPRAEGARLREIGHLLGTNSWYLVVIPLAARAIIH